MNSLMLFWFVERILGSNWREEWVVLHEDSSLEWYKDHDESDLLGGITLKVRI